MSKIRFIRSLADRIFQPWFEDRGTLSAVPLCIALRTMVRANRFRDALELEVPTSNDSRTKSLQSFFQQYAEIPKHSELATIAVHQGQS